MSEPITAAPRGRSAVLHAVARGAGRWAVRLAVVLAGAWLGILLLGRVAAPIGPFDATVALRPLGGGATLDIPPLGALEVDAPGDVGPHRVVEEADRRAAHGARRPARGVPRLLLLVRWHAGARGPLAPAPARAHARRW